jgi:hypothetical protein
MHITSALGSLLYQTLTSSQRTGYILTPAVLWSSGGQCSLFSEMAHAAPSLSHAVHPDRLPAWGGALRHCQFHVGLEALKWAIGVIGVLTGYWLRGR